MGHRDELAHNILSALEELYFIKLYKLHIRYS